MMQALYYDRDARPVSWQRWRQLGRQPGCSRVGYAGAVRHGAAGLGALAGTARRAAARGTSLHVVCAGPQTRQLLQLTGLDRALRLARTLAEALQALPAARAPAVRPARPPERVPARLGGADDDDD